MSYLIRSIQIIGRFAGSALKSFSLTLLLVDVLFGLAFAYICFLISADGSIIRGTLAAVVSLIIVASSGFVIAMNVTALGVIRNGIKEATLGRVIFDGLFEKALTHLQRNSEEVPTMSVKEVERILNNAAKELLEEDQDATDSPGIVWWLASKIQRIAVWATIRTITKTCAEGSDSVNLLTLRGKIADKIDDLVLDYLKQATTRITIVALSLATSLAITLSLGIRFLLSF